MNKILIASGNRHKVDEIRAIFNPESVTVLSLTDFPPVPEPVEDGATFRANAEIKAQYYYKNFRTPVIADDSGLVVPALNGEPGVRSARYAGDDSNYQQNNRKLLKELKPFTDDRRSAYFICAMAFFDGTNWLHAEGRVDGRILMAERGDKGFGYDPLFYYPPLDKTFAELDSVEKNRHSHRFHALQGLRKILPGLS